MNAGIVVLFSAHFMTCERQLIQCKADPNTVNEHGNTPLHYACFWGQDEVAEVLYYGVKRKAAKIVKAKWGKHPLAELQCPCFSF